MTWHTAHWQVGREIIYEVFEGDTLYTLLSSG